MSRLDFSLLIFLPCDISHQDILFIMQINRRYLHDLIQIDNAVYHHDRDF